MTRHHAIVQIVEDENGVRAVVIYADPVIWIADELMTDAKSDRPRKPGDLEVDGDLISFGTPGEGLGRLRYRLIGHDPRYLVHVAERIGGTDDT